MAVGALVARRLPDHDAAFWLAASGCALLGAGLLWRLPQRDEPGHRSPLPVYLKVPIILMVVATLILIKGWLRGFVTVFPMVGVIAAYEARNSLWTMVCQIPGLAAAGGARGAGRRLGRLPHGLDRVARRLVALRPALHLGRARRTLTTARSC